MEELDKCSNKGEDNVDSNPSILQLNGTIFNEGQHASFSLKNTNDFKLIIEKDMDCEALDNLSNANGENISTIEDNETEHDGAKLSSSLCMLVVKDVSEDEEEPKIYINRCEEVRAIDHADWANRCGKYCKAIRSIIIFAMYLSPWLIIIKRHSLASC